MKTRIIHTKLWQDSKIHKLSKDAKLLFIYLISSPHINLCGAFELPTEYIELETGICGEDLQKAKSELEKIGRAIFKDDWVVIPNATRYNQYHKSKLTYIAYINQINLIPDSIKQYLNSSIDSTIHTNGIPQEIRNKKTENINHNLIFSKMKEELKGKLSIKT